jgi:hypothetical protein
MRRRRTNLLPFLTHILTFLSGASLTMYLLDSSAKVQIIAIILAVLVVQVAIILTAVWATLKFVGAGANLAIKSASLNDARDLQKIQAMTTLARQAYQAASARPQQDVLEVGSSSDWLPQPGNLGG